jgi:exodeoxyribonuclease-3
VNSKLGIEKFDSEGRMIETHFGDLAVLNIYFPKGYAESDRLQYKLDFYDELFKYVKKLMKKFDKIIICGDFNTAHHAIDLARPEQNETTSGFIPIEREKLDLLVKMDFLDAFRLGTEETGHYTWWSQRGRSREKNIGWRIDYHFISKGLKKNFKKSYIQPNQEGSDHCPVVLELK